MKTTPTPPFSALAKGIHAIAGISKNSGKTSFLNYLTSRLEGRQVGVLTTGRDGEDRDVVFGNTKPTVRLKAGTLFTATSEALTKLGSAVTVRQKLPYSVAHHRLWLLTANRDLETEITGPSTVQAQIQTAELMLSLGVELVLIDGSLDRKSIALHPRVQGVFLVAGGSFGSLEKIEAELDRLLSLAGLRTYPKAGELTAKDVINLHFKGKWQPTAQQSLLDLKSGLLDSISSVKPDGIYLPGALTESVLNELKPLLKGIKDIVCRHPLQLHLSLSSLEALAREHNLTCLRPFRLHAIVLNSWSVKGNHLDCQRFRDRIRSRCLNLPVLDICEGTSPDPVA
jgi:hypothetical protein